jgi:hypothetical protein
MTAGGRGNKANAIGSKTSPPPSSCNRMHNGVMKSGIWLVCLLRKYDFCVCVLLCVCVFNKVMNHLKIFTILPYSVI